MAEEKEIFNVLDDGSGDGAAIDKVNDGDAGIGSKSAVPTVSGEDISGAGRYLQTRAEGETATSLKALPGQTAVDSGNTLQWLKVNALGELLITSDGGGIQFSAQGTVTATKGSDVIAASASIAPTKDFDDLEMMVSSFKPVLWKFEWVDDDGGGGEAINSIASVVTGSGSFNFVMQFKNKKFTAGAVGTQTLRVSGNQLTGTGTDSDLHAYIGYRQVTL